MRYDPSRRAFLGRTGLLVGAGAAAATLGSGSLGLLARALAAPSEQVLDEERRVIFCYFAGGWDILSSLDPRNPAQFHAGNMLATGIQPGYELLDGTDGELVYVGDEGRFFGPLIGDLALHHDHVAVVRGMSAETLTHEVGRRRFLTGKPPSGLQARGSSTATWLAARLGQRDPVPNLSVRVESYNVDQPNFATGLKVSSVPDLLLALRTADPALPGIEEAQVHALLDQFAACESHQRSPVRRAAAGARHKAMEMVGGGYGDLFDFQAETPAMEALRDHYGIGTNAAALETPEAQAAMAVAAVTSGLCRVVSIQIANGLDTHYDNWMTDHGPHLTQGFDAVARMIEDLASRPFGSTGESWLDHTTIIGFSEFGRSPRLNVNGGRDHHLTTAAFLAGAGVRGGTIVGRSSDVGLMPTPTNLLTGEPDPGGEVVRPEHLLRALYRSVGITDDVADLRAAPLEAVLAG